MARSRVSEARKAALVKAVKTVLACQEISNLMARFMTAMNYKQPEEVLACFALQQQDVSWEFADEGVFQGPDAVRQIIYETIGKPFQVGEMLEQHLNAPAIEVAGDLKTAKGFWRAPGFGAIPQVQMLPVAIWSWDDSQPILSMTEPRGTSGTGTPSDSSKPDITKAGWMICA